MYKGFKKLWGLNRTHALVKPMNIIYWFADIFFTSLVPYRIGTIRNVDMAPLYELSYTKTEIYRFNVVFYINRSFFHNQLFHSSYFHTYILYFFAE